MSRLIDADALLEGIAELKQSPGFNDKYGYAYRKEAVETIEDLCIKKEPTIDAVEVVRCKDCKWVRNAGTLIGENPTPVYGCHNTGVYVFEDGYCDAGERKEE